MLNIEQLSKIENIDIHNVFLCYRSEDDIEEFTSIADVLEFGPPNALDYESGGEELELMNDHLYTFSEELQRFIVIQ